jgi:hypothetical protein
VTETTVSRLAAPDDARRIVNGSIDETNTYANVGAFIVQRKSDGQVFPVCSGTLVAPTVFLTAGHCTAFYVTLPAGQFVAGVSFENPIPWGALTGQNPKMLEANAVITNPAFNRSNGDPGDLGVLILRSPDTRGITPAALPTLDLLDQLAAQGALKNARFTAVGYGLHDRLVGGGTPFFLDQNPEPRRFAISSFGALGPAFLRLSQNSATGDGGTCYGDSGGPNFLTIGSQLVLVATTVTGDAVCRSTNVDYRVDTRAARRFLGQFVSLP